MIELRMIRQPSMTLSIADPAVVRAVRDPLTRSVFELVRRFSRAATPTEIGKIAGIKAADLRRALDVLEEAGVVGKRSAAGIRREPAFFALTEAIIVTFESSDKAQAAMVEELDRVMIEHARARIKEARNVRPLGVPGFHYRCYVPLRLTAEEIAELKEIMHRLHRFTGKVSSRKRVSDDLEPHDCNYQIQVDVGPAAPGLLPLAPVFFIASREAPALKNLVEERRLDRLTPREKEVALALAQGRSRPEIAVQLGLSVNTVASVGKRVYRKFGVSRRAELAARLRA
jgi:DNA-binding CsgD family transcriptional regulator